MRDEGGVQLREDSRKKLIGMREVGKENERRMRGVKEGREIYKKDVRRE